MEHPISELMQTAMSSMKDMVDVNTVVGHPVQTSSGSTIIPISRVTFGYMTAGGDLLADKPAKDTPDFPFAGGSGAGVSVHPMGFLVVGNGQVKMLPTNYATPVDRVMELLPEVMGEIKNVLGTGESAEPPVQ